MISGIPAWNAAHRDIRGGVSTQFSAEKHIQGQFEVGQFKILHM